MKSIKLINLLSQNKSLLGASLKSLIFVINLKFICRNFLDDYL